MITCEKVIKRTTTLIFKAVTNMLVDIVPGTTKIGARTPGEGEEAAGEQQSSSKAVITALWREEQEEL